MFYTDFILVSIFGIPGFFGSARSHWGGAFLGLLGHVVVIVITFGINALREMITGILDLDTEALMFVIEYVVAAALWTALILIIKKIRND